MLQLVVTEHRTVLVRTPEHGQWGPQNTGSGDGNWRDPLENNLALSPSASKSPAQQFPENLLESIRRQAQKCPQRRHLQWTQTGDNPCPEKRPHRMYGF